MSDLDGGREQGAGGKLREAFRTMRWKDHRTGCWLASAAFVLDRVSKLWAQKTLQSGLRIDIWPGVLRFVYVENTGAAFGLLRGRQTLLAVFTGVILLAVLVGLLGWGRRLPRYPRAVAWLMLGGALGNLADRAVYGYVVDFIEIRLFRFPVFNVADMCVTIGFVLLAGWLLLGKEPMGDG